MKRVPPKNKKTDSSIIKNISEKFNPKEATDHKKQKTDSSIFKNVSEKFNPKEVTDHDIHSDLKDFINATFREGISDDQQTDLVKNFNRPGNMFAMVKTKVNQCIWRLLKPQK